MSDQFTVSCYYCSLATVMLIAYYFFAIVGLELFSKYDMTNCCLWVLSNDNQLTLRQKYTPAINLFGRAVYMWYNWSFFRNTSVEIYYRYDNVTGSDGYYYYLNNFENMLIAGGKLTILKCSLSVQNVLWLLSIL